MRAIVFSLKIIVIPVLVFWATTQSCSNNDTNKNVADSIGIKNSVASAPVLSPNDAIKKMHLEDGFTIKLVASEPLITAPVAMEFDKDGRIWVVQMNDYMPDTVGTGEDKPTGKVVILSDTNADGVMDSRKIFLDTLILPRAICLIEDGILVAESPNLWHYEIKDDKPGRRTLVDSTYAEGGNVEHQPNGLLRAMDNWIYSAKSNKRYRKKGQQWLIEKTHFRGQWGITQDDYGRLFYNTNSENILGDYFSPGLGATNSNQKNIEGFIEKIVSDNRVYPVRPTPGVNRGYMEGVLDDSLRLVNFTAACGPVVYRGHLFDNEYYGNAFVAEPSANLIKRNILTNKESAVEGRQAYAKKEFLASEDERFRPVNLYNGPDGAMYVVDMYRGIIQHKTYLTPYLKNEIKERELSTPLSCGRIYKIVPKDAVAANVIFPSAPDSLLNFLNHKNGWVRNEAQKLLIDGKHIIIAPLLRDNLKETNKEFSVIHSLWTLEGLNILNGDDVLPLLATNNQTIRAQALAVLPSLLNKSSVRQILTVFDSLIRANDTLAATYIGFLLPRIQQYEAIAAKRILETMVKKFANRVFVADAIITNYKGREEQHYKEAILSKADTGLMLYKRLRKVIADKVKAKSRSNADIIKKRYPKGAAIFQSVCQTCHGNDGNGVKSLAPPLNGSDWVTGDKNKLAAIVLYGMTGPIKVGDKLYEPPEINGDMPGIGHNAEFTDEDIAQVLNYIRNSWSNKGDNVSANEIDANRRKYKGRQKAFTMAELGKLK